jgi:glutathione-regulated potassium-efflux system protein KefB
MVAESGAIGASYLAQGAIFLAGAAIVAPLAKWLRIGSVLGYLVAGAVIGPYGLGYSVYSADDVLHVAELGIVLFLFLIGLELEPHRLWVIRVPVFGFGGMQVLATGIVLSGVALVLGFAAERALFIGFLLSLSSTAFALQVLRERGELTARHGRLAFAVLLFQDVAAIPLIAIVPVLSPFGDAGEALLSPRNALIGIGVIVAVALFGRYGINMLLRRIARTGLREAMTAATLLAVVASAFLMQGIGVSAALGGFLAGVALSDSDYRHEIEANLEPFTGLLLGLFFMAVGMLLDFRAVLGDPVRILGAVALLVAIKAALLYVIGRAYGLETAPARRFALVCSQAGEFVFVGLAAAKVGYLLPTSLANELAVIVTLSMISTPILLILDDLLGGARKKPLPAFDDLPKEEGHVIIAGFGRFGQIVARILRARGIPFTALDMDPKQIELVRRFGNRAYFGDASRTEILEAAEVGKAKAFVLAVSDVEISVRTAEILRRHYPLLRIFARARDRQHAYRLLALGVHVIRRETFLSALDLTHEVLRGVGLAEMEARKLIATFKAYDEKRLSEDFVHASDEKRLQSIARQSSEELEELFRQDVGKEREGSSQ